MQRALQQASRGLGRTAPNPPVGAVVVKDDRIVAQASHPGPGQLHAERLALMAAGEAARGADLYCTLEPCCHHGRTPPCTEIIIASGIRRVWYGSFDPDPRVAGQGEATLRAAGVTVTAGCLVADTDTLYEPYRQHKRTGRPFLTLKLACSLDGRVATASGHSRWITGEATRRRVHVWRDQSEAVLVGVGTVLADDPQLTVRPAPEDGRQPLRVVADSQARTPVTARLLREPGPTLVAVGERAPKERVAALRAVGADVVALPLAGGVLDLAALLEALGQRNVMGLFCEGGPTLATALTTKGLVDKFRLCYGPQLIGGDGQPAFGRLGVQTMDGAPRLRVAQVEPSEDDIVVTAYPCSPD